MSIAELEVLAARIEREVEESIEEDRAREEQAMAELETYIQNWIDIGAKDRDTAIRWILDSVDHGGDFGYACYLLGLPYKMENEFARVMEAA
jgi:hypothetical protein